jgi:hypothetical protein
MPKVTRRHSASSICHVMDRCEGRRIIFEDDADRASFMRRPDDLLPEKRSSEGSQGCPAERTADSAAGLNLPRGHIEGGAGTKNPSPVPPCSTPCSTPLTSRGTMSTR